MTEERFFQDRTTSIPIGIYGLSTSTDSRIVNSPNTSVISPIGSPIATSYSSPGTSPYKNSNYISPLIHEHTNSQSNVYEKEPYLNFDFIFEDDEVIGNFDKLSINNSNTLSPNRINSLASGPKAPLFKQNSLPNYFGYSSQEKNSNLSYKAVLNKSNQRSSPEFLNVPGKKNVNQTKTYNAFEDDAKDDYFNLFGGIEMETSYSRSFEYLEEKNPLHKGNTFLSSFNPGSLPSHLDMRKPVKPLNFGEIKKDLSSSPNPSISQRSPRRSTTKIMVAPNYNLKHSSRIIAVQNANLFRDDLIISCFEKFGELRSVKKVNNTYYISYYDLRCSQLAMQNLNNSYLNDNMLELSFYFMREFSSIEESNQGTLVVFNLDQYVSIEDLYSIFGKYGEIREIRESPNRKHKFIEFYDVREADMAMRYLNKTQINDKKIKIEPSRPGGNKNELNKDRNNYSHLSSSAPINSYMNIKHERDENFLTGNKMANIKNSKRVMTYSNVVKSSSPHNTHDSFEKRLDSQHDNENKQEQSKFDLDIKHILSGTDKRTTLMIKNIPNKYNQEMLLTAINKNHETLYDFFYLPIDFKNKCNVGYAFINFKSANSIPAFYNEFNDKRWEKFNSEKVCQISYARIQGKDAMIEHFKNSSLLFEDPKCQPLIFQSDGHGKEELCPIGNNFKLKLNK